VTGRGEHPRQMPGGPGILRRAAELALGPFVVRRRLPRSAGGGVLVVSAEVGGLRYVLKASSQWDPGLLRCARDLVGRGDVVWDVGANVGLFAAAAAYAAGPEGRVLAIEPDMDAVSLLNRSVRRQSSRDAPIAILPVAVSRTSGFVRFSIANRARSTNAIEGFGSSQTGGFRETRLLPAVALDELLENFPAPNVLKIDVEGAELDVLAGGRARVLTEARPAIYCEVGARTAQPVNELLLDLEYETWDASGLGLPGLRREVSATTHNLVAMPREASRANDPS